MSWMQAGDDEEEEEEDGRHTITVDENDADNEGSSDYNGHDDEVVDESSGETDDMGYPEGGEDESEASEDAEDDSTEEVVETVEEDEEQTEDESDTTQDEPTITTGSEVADNGDDEEEETTSDDDDEVTLAELTPDADKTMEEAQNEDYRWRVLVWSDPAGGKSHWSYTMPTPIVFIDTEGKASNIAHKFENTGNVVFYTPENYDEAVDALHSGIDALDAMQQKTGQVGTIVVDSMSVMWGWAKQKYVDVYYPGKDEGEVNFKSGLQGGDDWKQIKRFHNSNFRQVMTDSDYHLCWTAMREDDYEQVFEDGDGNETGDKPSGEKENPFKVDQIIRFRKNAEGEPYGTLQKSGFIRHNYTDLKFPTFDKHRDVVEAISEAEEGVDPEENINPDLPHGAEITTKSKY